MEKTKHEKAVRRLARFLVNPMDEPARESVRKYLDVPAFLAFRNLAKLRAAQKPIDFRNSKMKFRMFIEDFCSRVGFHKMLSMCWLMISDIRFYFSKLFGITG